MLSFSLLRLRDFRFLVITRFCITMALQAQAVIVGWQIYSITRDPWMLGLTGLAEAAPALFSALFAGHIVDKSRPTRIYFWSISAMALNSFVLMLLGGGHFAASQSTIIASLFLGVFISGIARSFTMPSAFTLLPRYVTRPQLSAASAWLNSSFQTAAIGGPAIAGLIYGGYGAHGAWYLPVLLLICAAIMARALTAQNPSRGDVREPAFQSIKAGWAFILKTPVVLSVMALDMFAVLFGGAVAMLPAYADQILHVGAEGLGALRAAPALGSVSAALFLAMRPMRHLSGTRLLWVFAGFGVCMIGFGLSTAFWLSMLFLAASGMFDCINVVIRSTIIQLMTPDHMRGRVSSVNSMFVISSNEIGAFESGTAARFLGLVPSVVLGGIATLGIVIGIAILSPSLRKTVIDSHDDGNVTKA